MIFMVKSNPHIKLYWLVTNAAAVMKSGFLNNYLQYKRKVIITTLLRDGK